MVRMNLGCGQRIGRALLALTTTIVIASGTTGCALFEKPTPKPAEEAKQEYPYLRPEARRAARVLLRREGENAGIVPGRDRA